MRDPWQADRAAGYEFESHFHFQDWFELVRQRPGRQSGADGLELLFQGTP